VASVAPIVIDPVTHMYRVATPNDTLVGVSTGANALPISAASVINGELTINTTVTVTVSLINGELVLSQ